MTGSVWVSSAFASTAPWRPLRCEGFISLEAQNRNLQGESLPADCFPVKMWGGEDFRANKKLGDFFHAAKFWMVSAACAEAMRSCDMGGGHLYPVALFGQDRVTPLEGEWFCLNFGNAKPNTVQLEQSPGAKQNPWNKQVWYLRSTVKDNEIVVDRSVLEGPDIWVEPALTHGLFMSKHMALALGEAKVHRAFGLKVCSLPARDPELQNMGTLKIRTPGARH